MRTFRLFLLPVTAAALALAQDKAPDVKDVKAPDVNQAAVESAERKLADCVVKKDKACLTEMTAESFAMHQAMEGRPLAAATREQFLRFVENQALTFQSIDEVKVSSVGDAAVATMRVRMISEGGGRGMTGSFLVTDVWVKANGQWKLAVRNAARAEKTPY